MPAFGTRSTANLRTVHPALQAVFVEVVKRYDCSVLDGRRYADRQRALFAEGRSTKDGTEKLSRHQPAYYERAGITLPEDDDGAPLVGAVDVVPYPIDWDDRERFVHFAGYVDATAASMGVVLRWGGDWNGNVYTHPGGLRDQTFFDLPHYEIASLDFGRWGSW